MAVERTDLHWLFSQLLWSGALGMAGFLALARVGPRYLGLRLPPRHLLGPTLVAGGLTAFVITGLLTERLIANRAETRGLSCLQQHSLWRSITQHDLPFSPAHATAFGAQSVYIWSYGQKDFVLDFTTTRPLSC